MHVLFLTHDSGRTGAPIALLQLMQWLKKNTDIRFSIVLKIHGEIEQDMRDIAPVYMYEDLLKNPLLAHEMMDTVSLIYGNTVGIEDMLGTLRLHTLPIIIHVHELEYMINFFHGQKIWQTYTISHYIAASHAVKQNLVDNHRIAEKDITVVYESIHTSDTETILKRSMSIRKHLKIAPGDAVVGACGSVDWRKGPDFFIDTASRLQQMQPNKKVHFIWMGAAFNTAYIRQIRYDVKKRGLTEQVRFIGPRLNPLDYIGLFDVFLMTSREDPFPLVVLEAASLKKPIICFADAGGVPEFVTPDSGYVVPYGDTAELAGKTYSLLANNSIREAMGKCAQERFLQDFNIDKVAPQIVGIMQKAL